MQLEILQKLRSKEFSNFVEKLNLNINSVLVFGSILTDDFNEMSDVDIALLGRKKIELKDILRLELFLEDLLGKSIDVVDLNSSNIDFFVKVSILNYSKSIYSTDNDKYLDRFIDITERYYRENELYFDFRRRDLLS